MDVDGLRVAAWLPGDDEYAERLQVSVVWSPHVYVNGHEVGPWALPVEGLPLYSATARLFRKEVERARKRALEDELVVVAAALGDTVDDFQTMTFDSLAEAARVCLARRGFPIG